jgi:hypothetical protein
MTTPEAARLADEAKLRADAYMAAGSFRNGDSMMAKERAKLHDAIDALVALIPQEGGQAGAEVAREAARYRHLRDEAVWLGEPNESGDMVWCVIGPHGNAAGPIDGVELDAAVDAAMATHPTAPQGG